MCKEECTGCGACIQACHQGCIEWEKGEFGFNYPSINKEKCIECGMCDKVCPIDKEKRKVENQEVFAAVNKNSDILKQSTSGGAFSAIAEFVLKRKGVVYGCNMDADMKVRHIKIKNIDELKYLRGSKYIQSDVNNTFIDAKKNLEGGLYVLYTGTPCQIAGLYQYLGKKYEKLITIDIVCHGVGSQSYFDKYLISARKKYGNIKEIRFRSKEYLGWTCGVVVVVDTLGNEKLKRYNYFNNYYYFYFLKGDIYRQSCYRCSYANMERQGDFSIGDFWGIEKKKTTLDTKDGCSLLIVNNEKAKCILKNIKQLQLVRVEREWAIANNEQLKQPTKESTKRSKLLNQYENQSAQEIRNSFIKDNFLEILRGFFKATVPYNFKLIIRKYKGKENGNSSN